MRTRILLMMAILLPFFAFNMYAEEQPVKKNPIRPEIGQKLDRSLLQIPTLFCNESKNNVWILQLISYICVSQNSMIL